VCACTLCLYKFIIFDLFARPAFCHPQTIDTCGCECVRSDPTNVDNCFRSTTTVARTRARGERRHRVPVVTVSRLDRRYLTLVPKGVSLFFGHDACDCRVDVSNRVEFQRPHDLVAGRWRVKRSKLSRLTHYFFSLPFRLISYRFFFNLSVRKRLNRVI